MTMPAPTRPPVAYGSPDAHVDAAVLRYCAIVAINGTEEDVIEHVMSGGAIDIAYEMDECVGAHAECNPHVPAIRPTIDDLHDAVPLVVNILNRLLIERKDTP